MAQQSTRGARSELRLNIEFSQRTAACGKIHILVIHEHAIPRDGLRKLLETQPDFVVVGEASSSEDARRSNGDIEVNVVLFDVSASSLVGPAVLRQLKAACGLGATVLLAPPVEKSDIVKALQIGTRGIVGKNSPTHLLYKSIRSVFGGEIWIGRESVSDLVRALSGANDRHAAVKNGYSLTPRELDILALVAEGCSNKDVARQLLISEDTVKHHMTNIFQKTGASQRLELALFAIHHSLVGNS